jgi:1-acyl-sn-glycerol-3-phosphate acyltransferase
MAVPKDENCIFAMNHASALDVVFALATIVPHTKRRISIFLDHRWFQVPFLGWIFRRWDAIRIDHGSEESKRQAVRAAVDCLKKGNHLLIFPEGQTIGGTLGEPVRAFTGAVQISLRSKKKIIPVGIKGSYDAWKFPANIAVRSGLEKVPTGARCSYRPAFRWPAFDYVYNVFEIYPWRKVEMRFGKPIDLRAYELDLDVRSEPNRKTLRDLTNLLMKDIANLADQRYRFLS